MTRIRLIIGLCLLWGSLSLAGDDPLDKANTALRKRAWQEAADHYALAESQSKLEPGDTYNFACVLALTNQTEKAMEILTLAVDRGFANARHLETDSDLEPLRQHPNWASLLTKAKHKQEAQEKLYLGVSLATPYRPDLSEAERIAGLSLFWSEAKYNFVNFELVPKLDWDALYLEYIPKVQAATKFDDYLKVMRQFCAQLRDGHTNIYPPEALANQYRSRPGLRTLLVENRVLVTEVQDEELAEQGLVVGTEILEIDGEPVHDYANREVAPYVSASTEQDRLVRVFRYELLLGDSTRALHLTLADAKGQRWKVELERATPSKRADFTVKPPFSWRMLPGNIAYVELNDFSSDACSRQFLENFDQITAAKAIIFDVRENGGGNSDVGWDILGTLTKEPFDTTRWFTRKYVPAFRAWGRAQGVESGSSTWQANSSRHYAGPVLVLTSARTYSAAEDFAAVFKQMKRGAIVGEPTGGSTGQPLMIRLPGGIQARICSKHDQLADGTEFVGKGIMPDLAAKPTVAGIQAGKDEVLEAALGHLAGEHRPE